MAIAQSDRLLLESSLYGVTPQKVEAVLLQRRFGLFVRAAWPVVVPNSPFVESPYIDALCDHLQALTENYEYLKSLGEDEIDDAQENRPELFRNLLVNIPPRTGKSSIISVIWPVWVWIRNGLSTVGFLTSSYSYGLAERDTKESRRLLGSRWFRERWGDRVWMSRDQNAKGRYDNQQGGYRIAVGKTGSATGEGGDFLIADDPQNAGEVYSPRALEKTKEWFASTWSNRINDPKRSCMVVVQQRIHEDDLTGNLVENGGWVHLKLPMQYEGEKNPTVIGWEDWRTEEGEYLNPGRFSEEQRADRIREDGESGYATQYQQRPVRRGGAILKSDNWSRYTRFELPERFIRVAAFADTASKKKQQNDYTAIALWGEAENGWYLLDLIWQRMEFPELMAESVAAWERWQRFPMGRRPTKFVVEDANSGIQLIQTLKATTRIPITRYETSGSASDDKVARINSVAGYQYSGKLYLPKTDEDGLGTFNVESFIEEHSMFPNSKHDDRVDTTGMMMMYWVIDPPESAVPVIVSTRTAQGRW